MRRLIGLQFWRVSLCLAALSLTGLEARADAMTDALNALESEWAKIYYQLPKQQQETAFKQLLDKANGVAKQFPKQAGVIYWQAVIKASLADHQSAVTALETVHDVRDLLKESIALDPKALGGGAYVVLGTLYHMTPPWPVAFGDDDEAEKMLQAALKISPNGIDSNYYYGQFLLDQGEKDQAKAYFMKASTAPIRPEQVFADTQLAAEAKQALQNAGGSVPNVKKAMFDNFKPSEKPR